MFLHFCFNFHLLFSLFRYFDKIPNMKQLIAIRHSANMAGSFYSEFVSFRFCEISAFDDEYFPFDFLAVNFTCYRMSAEADAARFTFEPNFSIV